MTLCGVTSMAMGTVVTIDVVGHDDNPEPPAARAAAIDEAFGWFQQVEAACSRFDPQSELSHLVAHVGTPVPVGDILFSALQFACALAEETDGAFDPAVGRAMERAGFDRHYVTGAPVAHAGAANDASFRDIEVDAATRTITLHRPLVIDLGAVAKGLAIDLAAQALAPFEHFAIDAGGDLYLGGLNHEHAPWTVGIRHPRQDGAIIESIAVSNAAVCTSGDYERGRHLLDPLSCSPANAVASATTIAPTAMLADGVSTAAFVLGAEDGLPLFERLNLDGLLITPDLRRHATAGLHHVVLSHT